MVITAMSTTKGMLSKKDSTVALALKYSFEGSAVYTPELYVNGLVSIKLKILLLRVENKFSSLLLRFPIPTDGDSIVVLTSLFAVSGTRNELILYYAQLKKLLQTIR